MSTEPKLIEAVARAIWQDGEYDDPGRIQCEGPDKFDEARWAWQSTLRRAMAVLAAIDASGEWWVAPVEATPAMEIAADELECSVASFDWITMYAAMRTAYLAKPEETAK